MAVIFNQRPIRAPLPFTIPAAATLILLLLVASVINAIVIDDCGSSLNSTILYSISNCTDEHTQCPFVVGTNVTLKATFTSDRLINSTNVNLAGHLAFFRIPFAIDPTEACGNWGLKCPMDATSVQTLQIILPIKSYYPRIGVGVEMQLTDEEGNILICCTFPAKIVSGD